MNNEFIINVEGRLHGIHTRLKELHYSAPSMSLHKLIDEYVGEFLEFDDALMEGAQALWGFINVGDISPELPRAVEFEELLEDIRGILVEIKREGKDSGMWTGLISRVDDFFETTNKYIYLTKIIKGKEH